MKKSTQKIKPLTFKQILSGAEKELKVIYQDMLGKSSVLLGKIGKQLEKAGETLAIKERSMTTSKSSKPAKKKPVKTKAAAKPKAPLKKTQKTSSKPPVKMPSKTQELNSESPFTTDSNPEQSKS